VSSPISRIVFYQFDSYGRASKTPVIDARVRRAIFHAIDRDAIIKNLLNGYGEVTNSVVNRFLFGYDKDIKGYKYDPAKAKALLKEAGYEKGFEIDMWQYYGVQNLFNQAAMDMLAKVGIKVKLHDYRGNIGSLIKLRNSGKITGIGNYAWGTGFVFDAEGIMPAWFLKNNPKCYAPDDQVDAWLTEARNTEDPAKRKALYVKAQKRIVEQVYWMPLFLKYQINAAKKNLDVSVMPYEYMLLQYAKWTD
ncbi:MAG: ABC transporter substrate-binding protein, partial [Desulfarculaceae bacterium]